MRNALLALLLAAQPARAQVIRLSGDFEAPEGIPRPAAAERPLDLLPKLELKAPALAAAVPPAAPPVKITATAPAFEAPKPAPPEQKHPEESPLAQLQELHAKLQMLTKENVDLRAKLEDQSRFVKTAVHDLNNPLSVLHGNLSLMEMHDSLSPDQRQSHQAAMKASRRLARLISGILDYAKAADRPLKPVPVDLGALLKETADGMAFRAEERGVKIEVAVEPGARMVQGDAELLRRLVENLISNGIKYNKEGGRLTVSVAAAPGGKVLSFSDEGMGIKAEDIPKLFGPFFRTDEARMSGVAGNGLGLAGARATAERHGGKVEVQSVPGRGTTFRVFLPG